MKRFWYLSLVLVMAVLLAACGQRPQAATPEPAAPTSAPPESEEETLEATATTAAEPTEESGASDGNYWKRARTGEFAGSTVTVFGKWTEGEGENFINALVPFEEATGIDVEFEGSAEFETLITVRVEGGDAPDVAGFPQPGLLAQFVQEGSIPDHAQFLDMEKLEENYSDA